MIKMHEIKKYTNREYMHKCINVRKIVICMIKKFEYSKLKLKDMKNANVIC